MKAKRIYSSHEVLEQPQRGRAEAHIAKAKPTAHTASYKLHVAAAKALKARHKDEALKAKAARQAARVKAAKVKAEAALWLKPTQLMARLNISRMTLNVLIQRGLPHVALLSMRRFNMREVVKWLKVSGFYLAQAGARSAGSSARRAKVRSSHSFSSATKALVTLH